MPRDWIGEGIKRAGLAEKPARDWIGEGQARAATAMLEPPAPTITPPEGWEPPAPQVPMPEAPAPIEVEESLSDTELLEIDTATQRHNLNRLARDIAAKKVLGIYDYRRLKHINPADWPAFYRAWQQKSLKHKQTTGQVAEDTANYYGGGRMTEDIMLPEGPPSVADATWTALSFLPRGLGRAFGKLFGLIEQTATTAIHTEEAIKIMQERTGGEGAFFKGLLPTGRMLKYSDIQKEIGSGIREEVKELTLPQRILHGITPDISAETIAQIGDIAPSIPIYVDIARSLVSIGRMGIKMAQTERAMGKTIKGMAAQIDKAMREGRDWVPIIEANTVKNVNTLYRAAQRDAQAARILPRFLKKLNTLLRKKAKVGEARNAFAEAEAEATVMGKVVKPPPLQLTGPGAAPPPAAGIQLPTAPAPPMAVEGIAPPVAPPPPAPKPKPAPVVKKVAPKKALVKPPVAPEPLPAPPRPEVPPKPTVAEKAPVEAPKAVKPLPPATGMRFRLTDKEIKLRAKEIIELTPEAQDKVLANMSDEDATDVFQRMRQLRRIEEAAKAPEAPAKAPEPPAPAKPKVEPPPPKVEPPSAEKQEALRELLAKNNLTEHYPDAAEHLRDNPTATDAELIAVAKEAAKVERGETIQRAKQVPYVEGVTEAAIIAKRLPEDVHAKRRARKQYEEMAAVFTGRAPEAGQPYQAEQTGANPVVFELPEIVSMAEQALEGKMPRIVRSINRKRNVAGAFRAKGELGAIALRADIFIGPEMASVLVKDKPEEIAAARAKMLEGIKEQVPDIKESEIVERMHYDRKSKRQKLSMFLKDPTYAGRVLSHEIGHVVDWLPEKDLTRGNILGRIASLHKHMKHTIEGFPEPTRKQVMQELKDLTVWWSPFDPATAEANYLKYRFSGKELYAEAISVLLNNPSALQDRAPAFYDAFFDYLSRKPEVKATYDQITDEIKAGQNLPTFRKRTREMFRRADEKKAAVEDMVEDKNPLDWLGIIFKDTYWFTKKIEAQTRRELIKKGEPPPWELVEMTERRVYAGSYLELQRRLLKRNVRQVLEQANLDPYELGEYMWQKFVINVAPTEAHSLGNNPKRAQEVLDAMKAELGPRYEILEKARKNFWKIRNDMVLTLMKDSGAFDQEFMQKILDEEFYATVEVADYIDSRYGKGTGLHMFKRIGTLKERANPLTATIDHDVELIKGIDQINVRRTTIDLTLEQRPEMIRVAEQRWDGKHMVFEKPKQSGWRLIMFLRDGKMEGYHVDPRIAYGLEQHNSPVVTLVGGALRTVMAPFRMLYTGIRAGFWLVAPWRDYGRNLTNVPGTRAIRHIPDFLKGMEIVFKDEFIADEAIIDEMLGKRMLVSLSDKMWDTPLEKVYEKDLVNWARNPKAWYKNAVVPVKRLFGLAMKIGTIPEWGPKVAAYIHMQRMMEQGRAEELGFVPEQVPHTIRTQAGTPGIPIRGAATPITNNMFLYSNITFEGIRSNIEAFRERPKDVGIAHAKYTLGPKLIQWALYSGAIVWLLKKAGYDDDDKVVEWFSETQKVMQGISDYDLRNYVNVPLWLTESGKSVYLRIPQDEQQRFVGGLFWAMTQGSSEGIGKTLQQMFDYAAEQGPGINPGLQLAMNLMTYLSGRNVYDPYYSRHAVPDKIFKAGGIKAHEAFAKWMWNRYGGTIVYRFGRDDDIAIKTTLEKVLGAPVVSDLLGRFIKVSDVGIQQEAAAVARRRQAKRQRILNAVEDAIRKQFLGEKLTAEERRLIGNEPKAAERSRKKFEKIRGTVGQRAIAKGRTRAEKEAIQKALRGRGLDLAVPEGKKKKQKYDYLGKKKKKKKKYKYF